MVLTGLILGFTMGCVRLLYGYIRVHTVAVEHALSAI